MKPAPPVIRMFFASGSGSYFVLPVNIGELRQSHCSPNPVIGSVICQSFRISRKSLIRRIYLYLAWSSFWKNLWFARAWTVEDNDTAKVRRKPLIWIASSAIRAPLVPGHLKASPRLLNSEFLLDTVDDLHVLACDGSQVESGSHGDRLGTSGAGGSHATQGLMQVPIYGVFIQSRSWSDCAASSMQPLAQFSF
jgi:hypothetical protein